MPTQFSLVHTYSAVSWAVHVRSAGKSGLTERGPVASRTFVGHSRLSSGGHVVFLILFFCLDPADEADDSLFLHQPNARKHVLFGLAEAFW